MLIIPSLYIKNGKPAVFRPGDYENLDYLNYDPYELIEKLSDHNIQHLYLVDIDASQPNKSHNKELIRSLANTTAQNLQINCGINELAYLQSLQPAGVNQFVVGILAVLDSTFLQEINDAKSIKNEQIKIAFELLNGRLSTYSFSQKFEFPPLAELIEKCMMQGFNRFHISQLDREHPDRGPDLDFYSQLVESYPKAEFSASGHIYSFEDIDNLKAVGISSVMVGDQIYKETGILAEVAAYNKVEGY